MYAADPDLHALENGRVNATFFEHLFMYMACRVGDKSTSSAVHRSSTQDCLETIAWMQYTNKSGKHPSYLQYYPYRYPPSLGDVSDFVGFLGLSKANKGRRVGGLLGQSSGTRDNSDLARSADVRPDHTELRVSARLDDTWAVRSGR